MRRLHLEKVTDHVPHRVALETEFVREVEKDVFNLLHGYGYLTIWGPGRVWVGSLTRVGKGRAIWLAGLRVDGGGVGRTSVAGIRGGFAPCGGE